MNWQKHKRPTGRLEVDWDGTKKEHLRDGDRATGKS